jgi:type IV secretion system protein TrbL
MWIGIFYAILLYGVTPGRGGWIPAIIDSFRIFGQNASSVGPLGPSSIVGFGANMCVDLLYSLKSADILTSIASSMALVFCAVVIFIAYLAIGIQLMVAIVESYLVIGAGVIFLGFGGSRWTAAYVGATYRLRRIGRHENPCSLFAHLCRDDRLSGMDSCRTKCSYID